MVYFQSDMDYLDCETSFYEHLKLKKGIKDLKVDHASNNNFIEYLRKKNDEKSLAGAVEITKYKAEKTDHKTYDELLLRAQKHRQNQQQEKHKER